MNFEATTMLQKHSQPLQPTDCNKNEKHTTTYQNGKLKAFTIQNIGKDAELEYI